MREIWLSARVVAAALLLGPATTLAAGEPPVIPPLVPLAADPPARAGFHDWAISCAGAGPGGCRAVTRLRSAAPGSPEVLRLAVAPAGAEVFALTLRTPAQLYLPAAATLIPDRGDPVEIPWIT
ncbi:MAG: hypothetical protein DI556_01635 [Rhodovulum sulfidophilum]|uniref:Uncharacterized protein n=1 Tax=Rhodovulum sulfidophilum TaxID=35806 RepID=A0A2W5NFW1_RHOSU|nr:MAG: hypothetical protein DI556_01635 [Rhodovulum sulfidophilum]